MLVVDDEELVRLSLFAYLARFVRCEFADAVSVADRAITNDGPWAGFIIDARLSDGSGLSLLRRVRDAAPGLPVVIYSGLLEPSVVNSAATLGAWVLHKPFGIPELSPFLSAVLAPKDRARSVGEVARLRWALSERETELLCAVLGGVSRHEFARSTNISMNTYKTLARRLLEKTGYENVNSLAIDLLRDG